MRDLIKSPLRVVFLGSSWESLEALRVLSDSAKVTVVCVITSPDKPVGRKQVVTPTEVKTYAIQNGIDVVHTENDKDKYMDVAKRYKPDIAVCKAFGEIIPEEFINFPMYKCVNVHFSLLPKYRGAVPIQKAILDGQLKTGITYMLMSKGLDEGDIIDTFVEDIRPDDTNVTLRQRLVTESSQRLVSVLERYVNGELVPQVQDSSLASYCWQRDISKENAEILWDRYEPNYIERMVRAFLPWPVAWTRLLSVNDEHLRNETMKIFKSELVHLTTSYPVGFLFSNNGMVLFSTRNPNVCLRVIDFQISGKNITNEKDFLNGIGKFLITNVQAHNKPNSV